MRSAAGTRLATFGRWQRTASRQPSTVKRSSSEILRPAVMAWSVPAALELDRLRGGIEAHDGANALGQVHRSGSLVQRSRGRERRLLGGRQV
jgi:hypothetical protein